MSWKFIVSLMVFLFVFLPGCEKQTPETGTTVSPSQIEEQPKAAEREQATAPVEPAPVADKSVEIETASNVESSQNGESSVEPVTDSTDVARDPRILQKIITTWQENARKFNKIKAVIKVEQLSPPPLTTFDKASVQKFRELEPEAYTTKKWEENIWLDGDRIRIEHIMTEIPEGESHADSMMTYSDGERRLLQAPPNELKTVFVNQIIPEKVRTHWAQELNPFYQFVRNTDETRIPSYWDKLRIIGKETWRDQECLLVAPPESTAGQIVYFVSPEQGYNILRKENRRAGAVVQFADISYQEAAEYGWVPTEWVYSSLKRDAKGEYKVLGSKTVASLQEFTSEYDESRIDLFALTYPDDAEVHLAGSMGVSIISHAEAGSQKNESSNKQTAPTEGELPTTHQAADKIVVEYEGKPINLNTFCLDQEGNLLVSCGGAIHQLVLSEEEKKLLKEEGEDATIDSDIESQESVILVYSSDRSLMKSIPIPFKATAMASYSEGSILIGGEGKLGKIDREGNVLLSAATPQIDDIDAYRERVMAEAKKDQARVRELIGEDIKLYQEQLATIEKVKEENQTRGQKRAVQALKDQIKIFEGKLSQGIEESLEQEVNSKLQMRLRVPSITMTEQDIFIALTSLEGFGFEIWRVDHDFKSPVKIVNDLRGCCGQMDVQAKEDKIYVAENGRFRVAIFDRDGKKLSTFGHADRSSKTGFGSCCNPMNVRCSTNGEILTAESSVGNIKKFSPDGELLANIGHVTVTGGCKNVAIEYDEPRNRYYMMDLPNHTIHIMNEVAPSKEISLNTNSTKTAPQLGHLHESSIDTFPQRK
ncbi:MAG: hypothetical protein KDA65_12345 [Planctomycetaceae bacterium]|nr:hypothetical protein [Planctomycetaceae bacterium]